MIPLFKVSMCDDVKLDNVLHSGYIGQGQQVEKFESMLGEKFGSRPLSLNSATSGLHLALRLAGVGVGDEVIVTPLTCTATVWPILMCGAGIVWADIGRDFNIDVDSIEKKIIGRTKAIIVVHWGGYPCDMRALAELANKHNLFVIEDAAHTFGSTYAEEVIGSCYFSDFTVLSFQAIKHLTCGDGGALMCKSDDYYRQGKLLRWYGIDRESGRQDMRCVDDITEWGYKYHMNDIAATIGIGNFKQAEKNVLVCQDNAKYYNKELIKVSGIELTQTDTTRTSSSWLYTMMVDDKVGFARKMGEHGIMVSQVHDRVDKHSCVKQYKTDLPVLEEVLQKMICIPCGWWVTNEDREKIVDVVRSGW